MDLLYLYHPCPHSVPLKLWHSQRGRCAPCLKGGQGHDVHFAGRSAYDVYSGAIELEKKENRGLYLSVDPMDRMHVKVQLN